MTRALTAVLVGVMEEDCRKTLIALLTDLGFRATDAIEPGIPRPDLVLATVPFDHLERVLKVARWVAEASPVVALLPTDDPDLVRRAEESGATALYVLGASIDALKALILRLRDEHGQGAEGA